ncbi:L-histidine N(alpha)-methyltransferase [Chitinimonas arctica]|uniref:L-histidine N(Alpha)-methyltransferase n=1 Tax=Chitinimonas arctica TaxID=2594795 RepID=A0A516SAB0_9NEIS|nr:L-histidine N(alpha)-methyltransferase [Chitinimonas arctica]QDQ25089.1 L-histidine N(alpha)-methyltransferase [Chitinimonas arctica]
MLAARAYNNAEKGLPMLVERRTLPRAVNQAPRLKVVSSRPRISVESLEDAEERLHSLEAGLLEHPPRIASKFFYDEQGCALYEAICQLDEYYPTRTEKAIFERYRSEIACHLPQGGQWVDLGCGDGSKSWPWLPAVAASRYVGVDIAKDWLGSTLMTGAQRCPGMEFLGVVTDFTRPLLLRAVMRSNTTLPPIFFYPGSSIGNFTPAEALQLLCAIRAHLGPEGRLLIGVDAPKDAQMLEAAYADSLGITAAFNRNVLRVVNRLIGSNFIPQRFNHRAWYNQEENRIEMHLVAREPQTVQIGTRRCQYELGDTIVTEYSYKYSPERFEALLGMAGFKEIRRWSDPASLFNVYVAAPDFS